MYDEGYLRYRNIRTMAWELLLRNEVKALPVDAVSVAVKSGITVLTYDDGVELIESCALEDVRGANRAFSLYTDKWYILYDADADAPSFSVAHELAHILLKHEPVKKKVGVFTAYHSVWNRDEPTMRADEQEANSLAVRMLAPACVLRHLRSRDTETIAALCGLTRREAFDRAERMDKLILKDSFLVQNEEERVYERFEAFIMSREDLFAY